MLVIEDLRTGGADERRARSRGVRAAGDRRLLRAHRRPARSIASSTSTRRSTAGRCSWRWPTPARRRRRRCCCRKTGGGRAAGARGAAEHAGGVERDRGRQDLAAAAGDRGRPPLRHGAAQRRARRPRAERRRRRARSLPPTRPIARASSRRSSARASTRRSSSALGVRTSFRRHTASTNASSSFNRNASTSSSDQRAGRADARRSDSSTRRPRLRLVRPTTRGASPVVSSDSSMKSSALRVGHQPHAAGRREDGEGDSRRRCSTLATWRNSGTATVSRNALVRARPPRRCARAARPPAASRARSVCGSRLRTSEISITVRSPSARRRSAIASALKPRSCEHGVGVLAERRRRRPHRAGRVRELDRHAEHASAPTSRARHRDHLARRDCGSANSSCEIAHRSARHAGGRRGARSSLPRLRRAAGRR